MTAQYTSDPIKVIDMDSHYTEPPGLWTERAPLRLRDRVPTVVEDEHGNQSWVVDGRVPFGPIGYTVIKADGDKARGVLGIERFDAISPAAYDVGARLAFLDEHGIHAQIMFPNVAGFGSQRFIKIADDELRLLCATIYNDAMADIQQQSRQRLFPQALVPFWDVREAMAEVRRAKVELGLTGIVMCDTPQAFGLPTLDAEEWDPFWSLCEDLDVAVNFHVGAGQVSGLRPWSTVTTAAQISLTSIAFFLDNSKALASMIFSGVLLRHPGLKIVSVESGIGWIPFLLEAMDYQYQENIPDADKRNVWKGMLPSDVFRRNCFTSFWFENWAPGHVIEMIGEDNVMFETDFPHPTCLYPKVKEQVAAVLAQLAPDVRRKVLHDTAARVYSLPA